MVNRKQMNKKKLLDCIERWKRCYPKTPYLSAEWCYRWLRFGNKTRTKKLKYKYLCFTKPFYNWMKEKWNPFIHSLTEDDCKKMGIKSICGGEGGNPILISLDTSGGE